MESDVRTIKKAEIVEKELRLADVAEKRASNFLMHEEEIFARPKRTWFQNTSQKKELAERLRQEHDEIGGKRDKPNENSSKQCASNFKRSKGFATKRNFKQSTNKRQKRK